MKKLGIIILMLIQLVFISCATRIKPIPEEDLSKHFTKEQIELVIELDKEFSNYKEFENE